jgi:glycosyltransferase involved in cell wall biosynthesis
VEGHFVVTLFGFLSRRKGHLLALEALKMLPASVLLLFAGGKHPDDKTSYVKELKRLNETVTAANHARITGYLSPEQVAVVMSATDLVIAPFTESSGSGSLALAFACGKPILASDIEPHREINQISPHALTLFPAGNANALANAILDLQESAARLAMMAEGARRYAATYSYAYMAEETVKIYQSVLAERN